MKKPPCAKDCENRTPGCHDHCKLYKAWKEEQDEEKAALRKERESTIAEHAVKKIWRSRRYGVRK